MRGEMTFLTLTCLLQNLQGCPPNPRQHFVFISRTTKVCKINFTPLKHLNIKNLTLHGDLLG